ncbi:MAG: DUF1998 domain-containing protein [Chloroflexi bacterium]|nr:DUF1998 domain-containing protein [Chloroflexota bacterium]MBI5704549.1 DUF1998 domain-containing protein [Chloroflexota bacterium]
MTPNNYPNNFRVGELNPSQLLYSFGVGAIVDLPQISVIVSGLDDWTQDPNYVHEIKEDRLLLGLRAAIGPHIQRMYSLPSSPDQSVNPLEQEALIGVPVGTFPKWMVCPACRTLASLDTNLFELHANRYRPDRTRYAHANCKFAKNKAPTALPARFLVACEKGHLDDFPWMEFVHYFGEKLCSGTPSITLQEYGPSGEARDLFIQCETCGIRRQMAEAFGRDNREKMPVCTARRPHLHDYDPDGCNLKMRPILLGASNLWFPQILSTIAIPATTDKLSVLVDDHWGILNDVDSLDALKYAQKRGDLKSFAGCSLEEILEIIKSKKESRAVNEEVEQYPDLVLPEWAAFSSGNDQLRSTDFQIRKMPAPEKYRFLISKVVLADRLREVKALAGFTRIDSPGELDELDEEQRIDTAPLSRSKLNWVPAVEVRGEGIFIQFDESKIQSWLSRPAVQEQERTFFAAHKEWRKMRNFSNPSANFPGMRYILLHTFSHILMRQIILESGYTQASIRERIYSRAPEDDGGPMAGILLYTSAPDSEGTLGGLVNLGLPELLGYHIESALEAATLCTSDPTCSEHKPEYGNATLHAAACHACTFAPETSCEKGNRYLDRAVLIGTISNAKIAFFE